MRLRPLMILGTNSGAGKSVVVTALCRYFYKKGIKVAPFKAQNMSLNSAVTPTGGEIGRAQAFQADACDIPPDVRMNPILLKPSANQTSQVILLGKSIGHYPYKEYYKLFNQLKEVAVKAFEELQNEFELIILEGAGSPAEINLLERDLVNTNMAKWINANCLLVADIDRGGVFASIKGTYDLLPHDHRDLLKGYIINKFKGDVSLLLPGLELFKKYCPLPCFGILPYLNIINFYEEDSLSLSILNNYSLSSAPNQKRIRIGLLHLNKISNWTDFTPFLIEDDVSIKLVKKKDELVDLSALIIPGSKSTIYDMKLLNENGLSEAIREFASNCKPVIGICGGFQILGEIISDENSSDGIFGSIQGLGLLPIKTFMQKEKILKSGQYTINVPFLSSAPYSVSGYEIHLGISYVNTTKEEILHYTHNSLPIFGTYLHGIFENDHFRTDFLNYLRSLEGLPLKPQKNYKVEKDRYLDYLVKWVEDNLDIRRLCSLIGIS